MNPASAEGAGREAALLSRKQFKHIASATLRRRVARAHMIGSSIWKRWSVGVYSWKLKHCRWFMTYATRDLSSNTRYQYWIALRGLLTIIGKERWLNSLRGPWCWPNGESWPADKTDSDP